MINTTTIRGMERERVKFAYECAHTASQRGDEFSKEYKAYVKNVPMLIKTNGLGAAIAFVLSKAKSSKPYQLIYDQTADWLKTDHKKLIEFLPNSNLMETIINLNSAQYRAVTAEVLTFFLWLRRFADGLIEGEKS